ncbi:putative Kunitz-type serine protease inhibitor isoform X2 [Erythrolamprus reginae]|uniref:putative Kunitz-type serine protease inhibitor isoform X2 n=1 Tax=Erythrolamprus reginae TaxID=121349 RepID=UPI00396C6970
MSLAMWITLTAALAAAESPPGRCFLPKTVGPCRASFPRWWYNATSQTCQEFIFGGCKGGANNFVSKQDCFRMCSRGATPRAGGHPEAHQKTPGFREFCAAPRVVGPCRASFPRWYFDPESWACKSFVYGGCRGNKNSYPSEEDCLSQCAGSGEVTKEPGDAGAHPHLPSEPFSFTRAVVLAGLLAALMALLLGSVGVFLVKVCRKNPDWPVGTVWNTLDDKEYLMSNAYTL